MIVVAVQHPVADYEAWKSVYDERHPGTFGALFARVNRLVSDPNMVTVVSGFESVDAANGMIESPDLKAAMDRAGVTAAPRIEVYEEAEFVQY
jgi:heme-degrading monooxygenase HmoA